MLTTKSINFVRKCFTSMSVNLHNILITYGHEDEYMKQLICEIQKKLNIMHHDFIEGRVPESVVLDYLHIFDLFSVDKKGTMVFHSEDGLQIHTEPIPFLRKSNFSLHLIIIFLFHLFLFQYQARCH